MSMKVAAETIAEQEHWLTPMEFSLPAGLIGIPEARRLELIYNPEELPLMWLRSVDNPALGFIVVEPLGLVPGYTIEMSDDDTERLGIACADDAFLLNVVNFTADDPESATVNLIGPIVVNRRTLVGRQIVIANFSDYSSRHPLLSQETANSGAR
jgi:flagellar assembly factor FliW